MTSDEQRKSGEIVSSLAKKQKIGEEASEEEKDTLAEQLETERLLKKKQELVAASINLECQIKDVDEEGRKLLIQAFSEIPKLINNPLQIGIKNMDRSGRG
ncbi:OLC1v1017549C1 [Oldenlandia corymbosa var. corymbosa]|uniref:OLC1v1017549C1 n=1 Tax=Oldenlandia corymbosa var. corymbosa TaxID=529605 RepID=A0AAV1E9N1_OLDCO|nr:OLC1v1017549C1 [Oldenlandia corymbosa var. corymbosa]